MAFLRWFDSTEPFVQAIGHGTRADIEALIPSFQTRSYLYGIVEYNPWHHAPLFLYAMHWNFNRDVWDLFVSAGVNINISDSNRDTALHNVSQFGYLDKVKYLVKHGANINAKSGSKMTPVEFAAYWDQPDVVAYLARHGASGTMPSDHPAMVDIYNKNQLVDIKATKAAIGALFFEKKKVPVEVGKHIIGSFLDHPARHCLIPVNRATLFAAKKERKKIADQKVEQKLDPIKKEEKKTLKRKKISEEEIDSNVKDLCNHIRTTLSKNHDI